MPRKSRNTIQKETIQSCIDKTIDFFSAEELHEAVQKLNNEIGIATIYRYLKELKKEGKIFSYLCDGKSIYSIQQRSHCHFICEETGKIIHFDIDSLDFLKNKIPGKISSFQIEVKGTCNKFD